MREIPLTQGKIAVVDDEDYAALSMHKWSVLKVHQANRALYYAKCQVSEGSVHRTILMHRQVMGDPGDVLIDHRDGDGLNNKRTNLRECSHSQNHQNGNSTHLNKTSRFKGVNWDVSHQRWLARICVSGKQISLGRFKKEVEAAEVYDNAARIHFREFARTNFKEMAA